MARVWSFLILLLYVYAASSSDLVDKDTLAENLVPSKVISKQVTDRYKGGFHIYCYEGEDRLLTNIWRTLQVRISASPNSDYELFQGTNATHVYEQYKAAAGSYLNLLPWVAETIRLPAFNHSCLGVKSYGSYHLRLDIIRVDYWKVLALTCGIFLFFTAASLSRNMFFYYSSGVFLGIVASLLILVFILGRLVPKKSVAFSLMVAGWGLTLYCLQMVYGQLFTIVKEHKDVLIGYVAISGIISFAICYRYGPVTNIRTMNLITWTMQGVALALIFFSTEWQELAVGFVIITLLIHVFPASWTAKIKTYWKKRFFRPKVILLTEDEYHQQGVVETHRALEDLQKFCRSPDCNSWKLVSRLRNPLRFAAFIEGESHLNDAEVLAYDSDDPAVKPAYRNFSEDEISEDESEIDVNGVFPNHHGDSKLEGRPSTSSGYSARVSYSNKKAT